MRMTNEEAKEQLKQIPIHDGVSDNYLKTIYEAIDIAIKALEQQPCEDCISRQAVLELMGNYDLSMGEVVKAIHALPPVMPKEKTGKQICEEGKSDDPLESFLGYMKNLYLQNKDEVDKVAKEMEEK